MKKMIVALSLSAAALLSPAVVAGGALVGYVSDLKCATSGAAKKTAAEWIQPSAFESCVKKCVKEEGSEAVFVTEDNKILKFSAASIKKITPFLGRKVSVVGKVDGSTITVDSISGLKLQ